MLLFMVIVLTIANASAIFIQLERTTLAMIMLSVGGKRS